MEKEYCKTREDEFIEFGAVVEEHIKNYTIPQYGDAPGDSVSKYTPEQCVMIMEKYCRRFQDNRRGRLEQLRDMVKISHFACITFWKMKPTREEIYSIEMGEL